jgi:uncharacterized protein YgiM (DUF1202 family)
MLWNHLANRMALCVVGSVALVASADVIAQTADTRTLMGLGEVTANDVYVRSGDSLNHYTICKLKAGDHVTVVGERGEWYEILPPEGTFSLISGDFVDTTDNQTGTVNGDNVRVRAGSLLNENKYTVQTLLAKGTPLTIMGRNPDGFVRIKPPSGATLWVSRSFVQLRTDGAAAAKPADETGGASPSQSDAGSTVAPAVASSAAESAKKLAAPMTSPASTTWRRQLEEIDVGARAELAKPVSERRFDPFIARYQPIAEQTEDDFARQYASARTEQVKDLVALTDAVERVRKLDDKAETKRRESLAARATIPEFVPAPRPTGIEVQGELRVSALYPPGSPVQRYRLIDPTGQSDRTIGYVEIPSDSELRADEYLGRYVGVRASAQRVQTGGVNPIPIYIARELVLLEPPTKNDAGGPN